MCPCVQSSRAHPRNLAHAHRRVAVRHHKNALGQQTGKRRNRQKLRSSSPTYSAPRARGSWRQVKRRTRNGRSSLTDRTRPGTNFARSPRRLVRRQILRRALAKPQNPVQLKRQINVIQHDPDSHSQKPETNHEQQQAHKKHATPPSHPGTATAGCAPVLASDRYAARRSDSPAPGGCETAAIGCAAGRAGINFISKTRLSHSIPSATSNDTKIAPATATNPIPFSMAKSSV